MEAKQKKMLGFVFCGIVLVGFILAVVGMFIGIVNSSMMGMSESVTLFDEGWAELEKMADAAAEAGLDVTVPSRTFTLIAFIVMLVGGAVALVGQILKTLVKKDIKMLNLAGGAVTLLGAILVLVAGIVLVGQFGDYSVGGMIEYSLGAGVILGFIGGLLAGAAAIVSTLKALN